MRYLLQHPFYQAWMKGQLSRPTLQDYARQYYAHVEAFPHYIENALSLCEDPSTNDVLAENLAEENGGAFGTSHPELWLRFAEGLGVARSEMKVRSIRPAIQNVVDTFTAFSLNAVPLALGSLYAYESQVPEIAHSKIEGLRRHYGITDANTLSFFEVHKNADVQHRESLLRLIERLPQDQQTQAHDAANRASDVLWDFLSDVYQVSGCV